MERFDFSISAAIKQKWAFIDTLKTVQCFCDDSEIHTVRRWNTELYFLHHSVAREIIFAGVL